MYDSLDDAIAFLLEKIPDKSAGLPENIFYFVSQLTPLVNVDLLIRDESGRVLLTWRDDEYYGPGWHVPGGIIRFKERAAERISAVAITELGAKVLAESAPCRITEVFSPHRDVRGHFISLLYNCVLTQMPDPALESIGEPPKNGMWRWFSSCPDNLILQHQIYRKEIESL